ncbi:MAG: CHRD domain-containing protein [Hyphomicrobiales bacterium]
MKLTGHALAFAGLALAAGIYVTQPASAETLSYKVQLLPSSEVPPNDTKGSGSLTATYDTTSKVLTWTATFSGLSGPAVAAHFHGPADKGVNAAVIVPQTGGLESPMKGQATLTDAQAADFVAGKWYYNIHTAANKGGEIRGQMVK